MVVNLLNPQQQQYLKEFGDYLMTDSGAWAIGDEHLDLIIFLLRYSNICLEIYFSLEQLSIIQRRRWKICSKRDIIDIGSIASSCFKR